MQKGTIKMSELVNRWAVTKGYDKGAKVELHRFGNGEEHYTGITRIGSPYNIESKEEAEKIIKNFGMELVY